MALAGVNSSTGSNSGYRPPVPTTSDYGAPPRPASDRAPRENSPYFTDPNSRPLQAPIDPNSFLPPGYRDALSRYYAPQLDVLNGQYGRGQAKAGFMNGYLDQQSNFANRGYQNDLSQLGIKRADLGIDRSTGESLLANFQKAIGLNNRGLSDTLANIDARLRTDTLSQNMDWRDKIQQLSSARVAGGFGTAPGYDIGGQQINEANANQLSALNNAALYARQQANLNNEQSNLGVDNSVIRQRGDLSKLDNAFASTGLQGDALKLGLDQKLAELGLNRFTNSQQLEELLSSTDAQKRAIGEQLAGQLGTYFGVSPQSAKVG